MLTYAAHRRPQGAAASPKSLVLIVAGHAVALGLLITAKSDFAPPVAPIITDIFNVPIDPPKPPPPPTEPTPRPVTKTSVTVVDPVIKTDVATPTEAEPNMKPVTIDPYPGNDPVTPVRFDPPPPSIERVAARLATPADLMKPPYPASKQRLQEEAALRLALTIDARGRVIAVDPVGAADPEFLAAARRHLLKFWRYKPATENGVAVPSRTQLTLRFVLDE